MNQTELISRFEGITPRTSSVSAILKYLKALVKQQVLARNTYTDPDEILINSYKLMAQQEDETMLDIPDDIKENIMTTLATFTRPNGDQIQYTEVAKVREGHNYIITAVKEDGTRFYFSTPAQVEQAK